MQIENAMKNSTWNSLMLLKSKGIVKTRYEFNLITKMETKKEIKIMGLI